MSYTGKTYPYDCSKVGLSANPNLDAIPPESMLYPSRNVNLNLGGVAKRGGTSKLNANQPVGTVSMYGYDFRIRSGVQYVLVGTSDGRIITVGTTGLLSTLKSGLQQGNVFNFSQMNNKAYVCTGADNPQIWDGNAASTSNLANIPSDWTGSNWPAQMVMHGIGNAQALWAVGCPSTPNTVYASKTNNGVADADFSNANVTLIYIETGDSFGIVGAAEYQGSLLCFGKRTTYVIDDVSTSRTNWGYGSAPWVGGAATWRLIVKTPNDVICMEEEGEIYSVQSATSTGDIIAASLARPAFIHKWIQDNVNLSYINLFHAIYDPVLRAVKIWVVKNGYTKPTTCLVYFIDRPVDKAWAVHDGAVNGSGYNAASSWVTRFSTGNYQVYTGDFQGFVWQTETAASNDDGTGYYGGIITPNLTFDDPRTTKFYDYLRCVTQAEGAYTLNLNVWADGILQNSTPLTFALQGFGSVLDVGQLGSFVLGGSQFIDIAAQLGVMGKRIQWEIFNASANQTFFISQLLCDHRILAVLP